MADISAGFLFGSSFPHKISCITADSENIITGSLTGEIAVWKPCNSSYSVGLVLCNPEESSCIALQLIQSLPEVSYLLSAPVLLVSLYSSSKLRVWDVSDGKCISYSENLFAETNNLVLLAKSSENDVFVAGMNEIFLIDPYRMLSLKYFSTEFKVLDITSCGSKLYSQTKDKLYIFDIGDDYGMNSTVLINNPVLEEFPTLIDANSSMVAVSNWDYVSIIKQTSAAGNEFGLQRIKLSEPIFHISLCNKFLTVCFEHSCLRYKVDELTKFHSNGKYRLKPSHIDYKISTKNYAVLSESLIITTNKDSVYILNYETASIAKLEFEVQSHKLPILHPEETITARNIILSPEVMLAIGTSEGRVLLLSIVSNSKLVYFMSKSPITAIYLNHNTLAIAASDKTLCFWDFRLLPGTIYHTVPTKRIEVWTSCIASILPLEHSKRNIDHLIDMSWKSSKAAWVDIHLAQCISGTLLLINFETKEIMCYLQAFQSNVTKATMFLNLEYLAVSCANGYIYIFNMSMQVLERELSGDSAYAFDNCAGPNEPTLKLIDKASILSVCFEFFFSESYKKPMEVKFVSVAGLRFPVLHMNLTEIAKKKKNFINTAKHVLKSDYFLQAFFGKRKAVSFKCGFVQSKYLNSVRIAACSVLNLELPPIPPDTVTFIIFSLNPSCSFRHNLLKCVRVDDELVALAEGILKPTCNTAKRHKNLNQMSRTFKAEKFHSQRLFMSIVDAICICVLTIECIKMQRFKGVDLIECLLKMIKSGEEGYVLMACELLSTGITLFNDHFKETQVEELTKEFLLYSCKDWKNASRDVFYKIMCQVGLCCVNKFIRILTAELKNSDLHSHYQRKVFFTIEYFVLHHFLEATSVLEEIGDFMLKAHELKGTLGSKEFSEDFAAVLNTFAGLLPMICLSQDNRFLIVGLPTGWLSIYDIRANKKWKSIKVFETTISAVDSRENSIACYSSQESCLKILKIDKNILGTLLGTGEIKVKQVMPLCEIEPVAASYQELIKTTKLRFISLRKLSIFRENKQEYTLALSN